MHFDTEGWWFLGYYAALCEECLGCTEWTESGAALIILIILLSLLKINQMKIAFVIKFGTFFVRCHFGIRRASN